MVNIDYMYKACGDAPLCKALEQYLTGKMSNKASLFEDYEKEHAAAPELGQTMKKSAFYTTLKSLYDPVTAAYAQGEYAKALKLSRSVNQRFEVHGYLSRMESDAVHSPIGLLHPITFAYIGMPKEYYSMDVKTRGISGHVIDGFGKGETAEQVIRLFQNALLPITDDKERYGTTHNNPFFGNSQIASNDPGSAFCNDLVLEFLCEFQIDQVIEKTAQPWLRPFIERFFWSLVTLFLCKLPGFYPKAKTEAQRISRISKLATLTIWEYEVLVKRFINDTYHFRPHKGLLGKTPIDALHHELKRDDNPIIITLPHKAKVLSNYCIKTARQRTIQEHKGIQVDNRMYHEGSITGVIYRMLKKNKKAPKVDVYIDHNDYSYIRIRDPRSGDLVAVPYTCMDSGHAIDECQDLGISTAREKEISRLSQLSSDDIIAQAKKRKKRMEKEAKENRRQPKDPAEKLDELNKDSLYQSLGQPLRGSLNKYMSDDEPTKTLPNKEEDIGAETSDEEQPNNDDNESYELSY